MNALSTAAGFEEVTSKPDVEAVFRLRAWARAYLFQIAELDLHDAVDALQAAAEQSGLVAAIGQDVVQAIMAEAFAAVRDFGLPDPPPDTPETDEPCAAASIAGGRAMMGPDFNDILREEGDEGVRLRSDNARKFNGRLDFGDVNAASGIDLRDYQIAAVQQIDAASSAIYVLAPGGGKTVIFAKLIEILAARGERVLVIVHRHEILNQTSRKLTVEHGIIRAGLNVDLSYPVQIASIQTLSRRISTGRLEWPKADVVIVDEAHHARAHTWRATLDHYPYARRYGLTATPCRGDGRGLGDLFDELIIGPQVTELQKAGHLVEVKYFAPANPDLKGVRTHQGDYAVGELAERMNRAHLVGDIVTQWHRLGERRRTIIFAVDVGHSVHIHDEFVKAGVRCEHLDGGTPRKDRDAILARLASGETEVVTNCMVLTEGFDCPPVGCIVLARPTKQLGLYRQMAGRGLRPADGKSDLILIDHSGAVHRHGLLEDPIDWTLDVDGHAENPTHKGRAPGGIGRFVECSQCSGLRERGKACPNCGFKPGPRPDLIICTDEDLVEVGQRAPAYSYEDKQRWLAMLYHIERTRGYRRGWARVNYNKKFGSWPQYGSPLPPIEPTLEVLSWVRSRMIAYSKSRGRGG